MRMLVFLICLLLKPLVHGDVLESDQPVPSRIPMSLHHRATSTYGLVNQGKQPSLNSLAKNYGGSESNAFFKPMMSKDTLNNQIGGSQLGSVSEHQTFNQIGSKEVSQSVNKNKVLGKTGVTSHGVSRKIQREITTTAELDALKSFKNTRYKNRRIRSP